MGETTDGGCCNAQGQAAAEAPEVEAVVSTVVSMADLAAQLDAIERVSTHAQKIEEFKKLAERLFAAPDIGQLTQFLARLSEDPPPQVLNPCVWSVPCVIALFY